jgi:hypothetical protein
MNSVNEHVNAAPVNAAPIEKKKKKSKRHAIKSFFKKIFTKRSKRANHVPLIQSDSESVIGPSYDVLRNDDVFGPDDSITALPPMPFHAPLIASQDKNVLRNNKRDYPTLGYWA